VIVGLNSLAGGAGVALTIMYTIDVEVFTHSWLIAYNIAYACIDMCVMTWAGLKLKNYITSAYPGAIAAKITRTLIVAALCYLIRSLIDLTFTIATDETPSIMTAWYGIYWAVELVLFYTFTDLVFLAMLFKVIEQQSINEDSIRNVHRSGISVVNLLEDHDYSRNSSNIYSSVYS
jgi:hypothetical protein